VGASKYAEEDIFDVSGSVGDDKKVTAEVLVKKLVSVEEITLSTEVGKMPEMPSTIKAVFTDGTEEMLGVKWNVTTEDVKSAGVKKVTGTVLDSDVTATAWIHVSIAVYASNLALTTETQDQVFIDQMVNGESLQARGMQGGPGEVYAKGIETKAPAEITIDIADKGYERFRSYVNLSLLNGGVTAPGAVSFELYLDDEKVPVFTSGKMTSADEAKLVDVDVTGVSKIRLVTKSETGDSEVDLADWVDAKFLSAHIAVDGIVPSRLYTAEAGKAPALPTTVQAKVDGIEDLVDFTVTWLSPVTSDMFAANGVQRIYGKLEGADANGIVCFTYMTGYAELLKNETFYSEVGKWSTQESFAYPIAVDAKVNLKEAGLMPKLIYSATSEMIVENVQKYGFGYGIYPNGNGGARQIVFAAPDLKYFQILNVASTADHSKKNFTFETSADGTHWTGFTDFTKSDVLPGTGTDSAWPQRTYTSNSETSFPAGTNFLRVTYPAGTTWEFNMTGITLKGGSDEANADLASFRIGDYAGAIDQKAKTVSLSVPSSLDITNITPEVLTSAGAKITPEGAQDFTKPVTYTVGAGESRKEYTVTVSRGVTVTLHPYGGSMDGSEQKMTDFIARGSTVTGPEGKQFAGWNTKADGSGTDYRTGDAVVMEAKDLTLYAVYKNPVTITPNAKSIRMEDTPADVTSLGLFAIDSNAGAIHTYRVLSGGTGKGRIGEDGRTLTVSKAGTIRIKLKTSETETHMKGEAIVVLTVQDAEVQDVLKKIYAIGAVTLEKKELIEQARKAYDALTEEQKTQIPQADLEVLTQAEAEYRRLEEAQNQKPVPDKPEPDKPNQDKPAPGKPEPELPKTGSAFRSGALGYKIRTVSAASKTGTVWVAKASANRKLKKLSVPAAIRYQNVTFKVTGIEKNAFKKAANLKTVKIGDNVTTISAGAFQNCKKLTKVTIGTGLKTIGKRAFQNDKKLKLVVLKSKKLKSVGASALKGIHKSAKIRVPKAKLNVYKKKLKGKTNARITK